ncbi:MAG: hypothetical protein JNJ49_03715 [Bdellovibrionaceae bacterium]|nr:hypothetical protein [Pseudobdellovibrionaceae bacterium]
MKQALYLVMTFIFSSAAHAEYRAFRLVIADTLNGSSRTVITTLDPLQYGQYHYLKSTERAQIEATWMCRERSENFKPICPAPETGPEKSPDSRLPANSLPAPVVK